MLSRKFSYPLLGHLLVNSHFFILMGLTLLQQSCVAFSILWMSKAISTGKVFFYLLLYILFLILPYIPGLLAKISLKKWELSIEKFFLQICEEKNFNSVEEWSDLNKKENFTSIYSKDGIKFFSDLSQYIHSIMDNFFNSFCSLLVFASIIDSVFILIYIISFSASFLIISIVSPSISTSFQKFEEDKVFLGQHLRVVWDNLILGNQYNYSLWSNQSRNYWAQYFSSAVKSINKSQLVNLILCMINLLPATGYIIFLAFKNQNDPIFLATLLVLVARLFILLNSMNNLILELNQFSSYKGRYKIISLIIKDKKLLKFKKVKNINKKLTITLSTENGCSTLNDIKHILQHKTGRITIRGANGVGKTTFLLFLKNFFKDAYFLPAQHQLMFSFFKGSMSTGKSTNKILREIIDLVAPKVLLLDEWDANLDNYNMQCITNLLEKMSKNSLIIEVRHR